MIKKFFLSALLIALGCGPEQSEMDRRLQPTAVVLQEEFARSEEFMPGLKDVKVSIGADCILSISNRAFGKEITRVNLKDLDPGGFSLIPDVNEGDFPGLRIRTKDGAPAVEVLKNGVLINQKTELVLFLADRPAIERITPYMLQAMNICQGVQY